MKKNQGPLTGLRIIDFTHVWQGPVGTQLLGDLGADVIKIERPGAGDWSRSWGPYVDQVSMPFTSLNRNKRSVVLDLKSERGRGVILRLVKQSDVLVHNFRPGTMEKLQLDYDHLKTVNPRLVFAVSTGWGDKGPYVEQKRPGHDMLARAATGWFFTPSPGELPVPAGMSMDYPAGLMLSIGILSALAARERTGEGQQVSTDLFSVGLHANTWDGSASLNQERVEEAEGIGVAEKVIKKSFRTNDGLIELSPVFSDNTLRDISVAMGLGDLSRDARFARTDLLSQNAEELNRILADRFAEKSSDEWIAELGSAGVLCGRINTFEEAVEDPQTDANEMIIEMEHTKLGALKLLGTPLRFSHTPPTYRVPPPMLGEHTAEVLSEMGYDSREISELMDPEGAAPG